MCESSTSVNYSIDNRVCLLRFYNVIHFLSRVVERRNLFIDKHFFIVVLVCSSFLSEYVYILELMTVYLFSSQRQLSIMTCPCP